MNRVYTYFVLLVIVFLVNSGGIFGQAIITTSGICTSDRPDYFTTSSCWIITGNCTPQGGYSKKNIFLPPPAPQLPVGTTVIITEGEYDDFNEDGEPIKVRRSDYIITASGNIIEIPVGETYTVLLGDRLVKHDGTEQIAEQPGVAPDPIFDLQGTSTCPVTFEINHPINAGNINLKAHVTLKVNSGGELNINQLTQEREITTNIIVNGGKLNISGSIITKGARDDKPKTKMNITILNNGKFEVKGIIDLKNNTHLTIDGDGSSNLEARNISFSPGVIVDIEQNGGLVVTGDTRFNGNDSKFNIKGYFETNSLTVAGGRGLELNTIGNAQVKVHGDVAIRGDATNITFGGKSTIEVGGDFEVGGGATTNFKDEAKILVGKDLKVNGGGKLNITNEAEMYVCGNRPEPNAGKGVDVNLFCDDAKEGESCARYEEGCFIPLPVNFIDISVKHEKAQRLNMLTWSTSKEWENSHFEIERSLDGTRTFTKIGEVAGMGWTDEVTAYSYEDDKLPLAGGNIFYRLKQVDFNGKFDYSDITAVRVPNVHFTKGVWRAYPNPNQGADFQLELVDISQYQDEPVTLRVLSSTISSNEMTFKNLNELNSTASSIMANAPNGLWIIELQWGNKVERIKVMKK